MNNTFYTVNVSIGKWEDTYEFIYKDRYYTTLDKAEKAKAVLDVLIEVLEGVINNHKDLPLSSSEGFKPLITLDERFICGGWFEVPVVSINKIEVNII